MHADIHTCVCVCILPSFLYVGITVMQFAVLSSIVMHCIVLCMYVYMYVFVYGWLEGWMYACVCLHTYMFIHLCVLMHAASMQL